jgi:hypothetical protein
VALPQSYFLPLFSQLRCVKFFIATGRNDFLPLFFFFFLPLFRLPLAVGLFFLIGF